jgi:tetratricopeptide (TPR) repeat protein
MKVSSRRSLIAPLLLVAATLIMTGCGGAAARFQSHLQRGRAYMDKGDYTHANIEFRNALQIAPKDSTARLLAAQVAEKLGRPREAAGLYQAIIDTTPDDAAARAGLGRLYVFGDVPDRALAIVEPGLAKHPDDVPLLIVRGSARVRMKNESGAVADADRALHLAPTNPDAIVLRVGLYQRQGDTTHAIDLLTDGVRKLPQSPDLREVLAQLYLSAHQPEKTAEQLQALVQLEPRDFKYRKQLALFYASSKRLDDAQRVLEEAVKALPKSAAAKLTLVSFLSTQRTREQGEKLLRGFITQDPDNYELRFGLGELLQRAGASKDALDTYNEIVARDGTGPQGLMARDRIASIELDQGKVAEARKLIGEVLTKSPRDGEALLTRGKIELANKDPVAAIGDFRAILADQPRSVPVQWLLSRAYLANGQSGLAEQALRAALEVAPNDIPLRIELARFLTASARAEQAIDLLNDTVRIAPKDPRPREMLVRTYLAKSDLPSARSAADDLKTLLPDAAAPAFLAGIVAERQKRLDDAQKEYERALAIQPWAFDVISSLARLEVVRHEEAQAIALVKSAAEHDPKSPLPHGLLGDIYLNGKDFPAAIDEFNTAIALAPNWWPAYRSLALAKFAAKDAQGAISAYQAGIKSAPAEPQLVTELASLYEQQSRADDAISLYQAWNQRNPQVPGVANNLAMLLVTYKTDQSSLDRARDLSASFADSDSPALLDTYGWVRFKLGDVKDALPALERAVDRTPDSQVMHYHLAMAQLKSGQRDKALLNLQTALSGAANFTGSNEARQALNSLTGGRPG